MQCPKCKREIEDGSLKCSYCKTKLGALCKDCGTFNLLTSTECSSCGRILLKICKSCNSANLPQATVCRKCGETLSQEEIKPRIEQKTSLYQSDLDSQQKTKAKLLEGIKNADSKIITICGESGLGKSLIIRHAIADLKNAKLVWLWGSCTQISQLSTFGYFQDLLLTFFNINNFCPDTLQLKKDSLKFFKQEFPILSNNEILDLLNFLYPDSIDRYENIYFNKQKMFGIIKKVILTIVEKAKVIFVIDNFDYIDGMSFDFFKELLDEEIVQERCKFIFTLQNSRPGLGIITSPNYTESNYLDLNIASFTDAQIDVLLKQYSKNKYDKDFITLVKRIACGNPSIVEQLVLLQNEIVEKNIKNISFTNYEKAIELRLNLLKQESISTYRLLIAMSILGEKFYPAVLSNFNDIENNYENSVEILVERGFITQLTNCTFEFKTTMLWKTIVSLVKNETCFEEILNILYETLSFYKQSSIALIGYILQKLNNNDQAFEVWTLLMKQASYIGDIGLYIITQRQCLKLIENKANDFYLMVKKNINTRLGKLLEPIDHKMAFDFLQNAVMNLDDDDDAEHVELLGYLASCAMKSGNYWGAIECVENVLNKLSDNAKLDKVLVKSRMVKPLLRLGNYGQLINLVENEILPDVEKLLAKGKNTELISAKNLFELWLDIYFDFAESLVFQGDNRAFDIIQNIYEILDKNKVVEPYLICRANLLLALANTVRGDLKVSSKILEDILKEYSLDAMDDFIVSRWNFIDIFNKFFRKDYSTLHTELFNVAAYANNVNDNFTKNILKTLLAKILKENNQTKKALEILEEQVAYFAKEKVATGVLLSWYLIAEIKLITNGTQFALDIATKALDIAQAPNINNYYFITLFNKLIGEIYLAKQDFDSAKVYFEKAIFLSKQFDLQFILIKTYIQCAKLYQELALPKTSSRNDYVKQALKMFQLAKAVDIVAEQPAFQKLIKEELNILTSFCKLNGIILKKESK